LAGVSTSRSKFGQHAYAELGDGLDRLGPAANAGDRPGAVTERYDVLAFA
jgi:hypothetical protein